MQDCTCVPLYSTVLGYFKSSLYVYFKLISIYLSIRLSVYQSINQSIDQSIIYPFIYPSCLLGFSLQGCVSVHTFLQYEGELVSVFYVHSGLLIPNQRQHREAGGRGGRREGTHRPMALTNTTQNSQTISTWNTGNAKQNYS